MVLKACLYVSAAAAALVATAAHAEVAASDGPTLSEVIVTAEKREASLQSVPAAVSAYTAETRQVLGLNSLADFTKFTPGLTYASGTDRVFLRGVGRQTNTNGSDPGVATYADGVYNAATSAASASDFFIDRVEILRGPQGTLYGRNSIGGAINAISRRPGDKPGGEIRLEAGDYGLANLEAGVWAPLNDRLRVRLAGARYEQRDGYFTNVAGLKSEGGAGVRSYLEGQVQADLGEGVDLWVKAFTGRGDTRGRTANSADPYDYAPFPNAYVAPGSAFGFLTGGYSQLGRGTTNPGASDLRDFSADTVSRARLHDNYGITAQLSWRLPGAELKYIGGYQTYRYDAVSDLDGTSVTSYVYPLNPLGSICGLVPGCAPLKVFPSQRFGYVEDKSFQSHELDLSSTGEGALQWIGGLYYYQETYSQESHFNAGDQPQLRAPANGPANPSGDFVFAGSRLKTYSYAAFGQADWSLSPRFKLTGGLRYSHDEKRGGEAFRILCFGLPSCGFTPDNYGSLTPALDITAASASFAPAPGVASTTTIDPVTGIAQRALSASWSALSGTAGAEWTPDRQTLAFVRYSRGYKSGGFNAGGIARLPQTDPEYVDAFELGYKRTFTPRVLINAAAFSYRYTGLQVPLTVTIPGGANMTQFFNLEDSRSWGLELEGLWRPTAPLTLMLSYGYNGTRIEKACCFVDGADPLAAQAGAQPVGSLVSGQQSQSLKGNHLPGAPEHKVALNASYRFDFEPGDLVLSASYVWKGETYYSVFNRAYTRAPAYDDVDLRAVWTDAHDRYRVIVYVKNLFDRLGYEGADGARRLLPSTIATTYNLTPPRTVGAQLQLRF